MHYRDTGFTEGVQYSLVNNVWGIHYSWGYVIHCDTRSDSASNELTLMNFFALCTKPEKVQETSQNILVKLMKA